MSVEQKWSITDICQSLTTTWLARPVHYTPTVGSTNDWLKELAANGATTGTLAITDFQTTGRGRLNHYWQAPAGTSLLFSLLFRPNWPAEQVTWLTMLAGLATCQAVEQQTGLSLCLKWPNDLGLINERGVFRKLAGILLECQFRDNQISQAIMGIGLNVNIRPEQLPQTHTPPTSLSIELSQPLPRLPLLLASLKSLEQHYEAANRGQSPQPAWNERLITRYRPVSVSNGAIVIQGMAEGTDEWGQLQVRDKLGKLHLVPAGEVSLRSLDEHSLSGYN